MKPWKRLTAGALSLILALSLLAGGLPAAYAADAGTPSGSIGWPWKTAWARLSPPRQRTPTA